MTQPKPKFPFWIISIIAVLIITVFIIGNFFAVKHIVADVGKPTRVEPFREIPARIPLKIEHIIAIATIITPTAIVIANILLVTITLYYARQTAKMAEESKKLVDYYHQTRKYRLKPLFIPHNKGYKEIFDTRPVTTDFIFLNIGADAIIVRVYLDGKIKTKENLVKKLDLIAATTSRAEQMLKPITDNLQEVSKTSIVISFKDVLLNEYSQSFEFKWQTREMKFDESNLPKEKES